MKDAYLNGILALLQEAYYNVWTITLRNFVVPTRSVWWVILLRETGVVHRIIFSFNYLFFTSCFIYSIYSRYKVMERFTQ